MRRMVYQLHRLKMLSAAQMQQLFSDQEDISELLIRTDGDTP